MTILRNHLLNAAIFIISIRIKLTMVILLLWTWLLDLKMIILALFLVGSCVAVLMRPAKWISKRRGYRTLKSIVDHHD